MHTQEPVHSRKRQRSVLSRCENHQQKKQVNHPSGSQPPAAFWDNLSKIWLTRNALRELDQRNHQAARRVFRQERRQISKPVTRAALAQWTQEEGNWQSTRSATEFLNHCSSWCLRDIKAFARLGGPDLLELRGYQKPVSPLLREMSSSQSNYRVQKRGLSASRGSSTSRNTKPSKTTTTKSSGPYDRDFQQHLIDYGVYPHAYEYPDGRLPPKPSNWDEIKERLARPRASLSPSAFTEEAHEKFIRADARAFKEKQVTESVIPIIEGDIRDARCVAGGVPFRNLDHLTDGTLVPGNPDCYYGARPEQLKRQIRNELSCQVIPSTQHDLPIIPNFLLAAKGPDGLLAVAGRQASYDGALGARSMHSLQTYGQEQPVFDKNAYTITSIYHGGQLKIFTSHLFKTTAADQPEYYMTQLRSFAMTDNAETFRQGATWYRNGRDWAKEQRDDAIRRTNERAIPDLIESTAVNASFSTICEISSDESYTVESISRQSHFSFHNTFATETHDDSETSADASRLTGSRSERSRQSQGTRRIAHGFNDTAGHAS